MNNLYSYIVIAVSLFTVSCADGFLDLKPSKSQVVPQTADDLWAILNNTTKMNIYYPSIGEPATDNYFYDPTYWQGMSDLDMRNAYIWSKDIFLEGQANDWSFMYVVVFNANIVLESLEDNKHRINTQQYNALKGTALFFRAYAFYHLAQYFMAAYDAEQAKTKFGIALRLDSDLNIKSKRSTMEDSYRQIIRDLIEAVGTLPFQTEVKTLPTAAAGLMMLSKTYMCMGDYQNALDNALKCEKLTDTKLVDFNSVSPDANTPFSRFNQEVIFHSLLLGSYDLSPAALRIAPDLIDSYEDGDLRKDIYFRWEKDNRYSFKGSYDGSSNLFGGLARDELYLIIAECYARKSDPENARKVLGELLDKRFKIFTTYQMKNLDDEQLLSYILEHRRKELILRGTRWSDLKRLNKEPRFAKTLSREINGVKYVLEPNSVRYVFPIPLQVITLSGMQQNE